MYIIFRKQIDIRLRCKKRCGFYFFSTSHRWMILPSPCGQSLSVTGVETEGRTDGAGQGFFFCLDLHFRFVYAVDDGFRLQFTEDETKYRSRTNSGKSYEKYVCNTCQKKILTYCTFGSCPLKLSSTYVVVQFARERFSILV